MNNRVEENHERFNELIGELTELVIEAANADDGKLLGFPKAFAFTCDLIYSKAAHKRTKILVTLEEWKDASLEEIARQFDVIEECITEQKNIIKLI